MPNNRASEYELKTNISVGEKDIPSNMVGDFNAHLSIMERSSKQKTSKDIVELNRTIAQPDIRELHRPPPSTTADTHSAQVQIEYLPRLTTFLIIEHTLTYLK